MEKEKIERNKGLIKKYVLEDKREYRELLSNIGLGWEDGIETDKGLVETIYEALEWGLPEIEEVFSWLEEDETIDYEDDYDDYYYEKKYGAV